jgi:hypothetical protein
MSFESSQSALSNKALQPAADLYNGATDGYDQYVYVNGDPISTISSCMATLFMSSKVAIH